jgi:hypothetical protein
MGDEFETESTEEVESQTEDSGTGDSHNTAWDSLLSVVPEQLHSQVKPILQEWDANFTKGVQKVHDTYGPYKEYLDNGVTPDQINYGLNTLRAIEERPGEVMNAIREYAKANNMTIQEAAEEVLDGGEDDGEGEELSPELQKIADLENQLATVSQFLVQQQQSVESEAADEELTNELATLKQEHGDFDEQWVLMKAITDPDKPLEHFVKEYKEFVNGILSNARKPGPKVLGGGGAAPNNQISPREMNDSQRRSYIAKLLETTSRESQ